MCPHESSAPFVVVFGHFKNIHHPNRPPVGVPNLSFPLHPMARAACVLCNPSPRGFSISPFHMPPVLAFFGCGWTSRSPILSYPVLAFRFVLLHVAPLVTAYCGAYLQARMPRHLCRRQHKGLRANFLARHPFWRGLKIPPNHRFVRSRVPQTPVLHLAFATPALSVICQSCFDVAPRVSLPPRLSPLPASKFSLLSLVLSLHVCTFAHLCDDRMLCCGVEGRPTPSS
jgi:hypothetical protein